MKIVSLSIKENTLKAQNIELFEYIFFIVSSVETRQPNLNSSVSDLLSRIRNIIEE